MGRCIRSRGLDGDHALIVTLQYVLKEVGCRNEISGEDASKRRVYMCAGDVIEIMATRSRSGLSGLTKTRS